jgi:hypothetical protein
MHKRKLRRGSAQIWRRATRTRTQRSDTARATPHARLRQPAHTLPRSSSTKQARGENGKTCSAVSPATFLPAALPPRAGVPQPPAMYSRHLICLVHACTDRLSIAQGVRTRGMRQRQTRKQLDKKANRWEWMLGNVEVSAVRPRAQALPATRLPPLHSVLLSGDWACAAQASHPVTWLRGQEEEEETTGEACLAWYPMTGLPRCPVTPRLLHCCVHAYTLIYSMNIFTYFIIITSSNL